MGLILSVPIVTLYHLEGHPQPNRAAPPAIFSVSAPVKTQELRLIRLVSRPAHNPAIEGLLDTTVVINSNEVTPAAKCKVFKPPHFLATVLSAHEYG